MKVHNDLKELLLAFLDEYFDRTTNSGSEDEDLVLNDFVANNSLALGKPKPLAKNKHTQNFCDCSKPDISVSTGGGLYCKKCLKWH